MQVLIKTRAAQAAPLREFAEQRVRFAMRRLSAIVPRAHVHLSDVNGPRGGLDKQCRIELQTAAGRPVVVTTVARDWHAALEQALARAHGALVRLWHRRPGHGRPRSRVSEPG
jgi:hypothetical protein